MTDFVFIPILLSLLSDEGAACAPVTFGGEEAVPRRVPGGTRPGRPTRCNAGACPGAKTPTPGHYEPGAVGLLGSSGSPRLAPGPPRRPKSGYADEPTRAARDAGRDLAHHQHAYSRPENRRPAPSWGSGSLFEEAYDDRPRTGDGRRVLAFARSRRQRPQAHVAPRAEDGIVYGATRATSQVTTRTSHDREKARRSGPSQSLICQ